MLTLQDGVGFQDLLLNPRMLATDGGQELQDELGGLRLASPRLAAAKRVCRDMMPQNDNFFQHVSTLLQTPSCFLSQSDRDGLSPAEIPLH